MNGLYLLPLIACRWDTFDQSPTPSNRLVATGVVPTDVEIPEDIVDTAAEIHIVFDHNAAVHVAARHIAVARIVAVEHILHTGVVEFHTLEVLYDSDPTQPVVDDTRPIAVGFLVL